MVQQFNPLFHDWLVRILQQSSSLVATLFTVRL